MLSQDRSGAPCSRGAGPPHAPVRATRHRPARTVATGAPPGRTRRRWATNRIQGRAAGAGGTAESWEPRRGTCRPPVPGGRGPGPSVRCVGGVCGAWGAGRWDRLRVGAVGGGRVRPRSLAHPQPGRSACPGSGVGDAYGWAGPPLCCRAQTSPAGLATAGGRGLAWPAPGGGLALPPGPWNLLRRVCREPAGKGRPEHPRSSRRRRPPVALARAPESARPVGPMKSRSEYPANVGRHLSPAEW